MTKIVNSWNEWDPLKRVIVGRPEGTCIPAPNPGWWHDLPKADMPLGSYGRFPDEMVDEANAQMDYFVSVMEKRGIIVDRVTIHPSMLDDRAVSTPDWTQVNQHGINNTRDLFLPVGSEIQEATGSRRERWFEYLNMRPLFEQYFKEDPEFIWTSAPKPRLDDATFEKNYYHKLFYVWSDEEKNERLHNWEFQTTNREPLWDAADACRFGKDIFWQGSAVTNKAGMDWLKRYWGARGIRIHHVQFEGDYHPVHIDVNLTPVRPGLAIYNPVKSPFTPEFWDLMKKNDWELVPAAEPTWVHQIPLCLYDVYQMKSWISMNTFSLGPNTICVEAHETAYMEQLDKLGIEVVPIPYEKVTPFGGALHCTTLDVYREGTCEDYFPNQIPGY
jgi:glycine amidinotransferase